VELMARRVTRRGDSGQHPASIQPAVYAGPSWEPADVAGWLAGPRKPIEAQLGARSDGVYLMYPGRVHTLAAPTEAGKTWLGLHWCAQEIQQGNDVAYVDLEDSIDGILLRLTELVDDDETIARRFRYYSPMVALDDPDEFAESLRTCTLAVLDGVTEYLALHGLQSKVDTDIAEAIQLPRKIAAYGPAALSFDHVTKESTGGDTRFPIGSEHKLAGITGASFMLQPRKPMGQGLKGRSTLSVSKDRCGQLRQLGPTKNQLTCIGDLTVDSTGAEDRMKITIDSAESTVFRPTSLMMKASMEARKLKGGTISKTALTEKFHGQKTMKLQAVERLIEEGYLSRQSGRLRHVKLFTEIPGSSNEEIMP
jgi:hypothetical protein